MTDLVPESFTDPAAEALIIDYHTGLPGGR